MDQICGQHELCPHLAAADAIAPPSTEEHWAIRSMSMATSPSMVRQALAHKAGQKKVGAGRNTRLYCHFEEVNQVSCWVWSMGTSSFVSELWGSRWHDECVLPWPCSLTRHFGCRPVTNQVHRCCHHSAKWTYALRRPLSFLLPQGWLLHCRKHFPRQSNV